MNSTVQNHLEARRLEERAANDQELTGFWQKVLIAYADAVNAGSSPSNQLLRAYDAARIAAFAIIRAAGYRTRGGDSHHYVTFDVARSAGWRRGAQACAQQDGRVQAGAARRGVRSPR